MDYLLIAGVMIAGFIVFTIIGQLLGSSLES